MRLAPAFAVYCLLILLGFAAAKYQGWALFGSTSLASAATGGTRTGGASGFHK